MFVNHESLHHLISILSFSTIKACVISILYLSTMKTCIISILSLTTMKLVSFPYYLWQSWKLVSFSYYVCQPWSLYLFLIMFVNYEAYIGFLMFDQVCSDVYNMNMFEAILVSTIHGIFAIDMQYTLSLPMSQTIIWNQYIYFSDQLWAPVLIVRMDRFVCVLIIENWTS